jgi:2-haloacid dehalogenase
MLNTGSVRALTFDIFGTTVDWRSGVISEGERLGASLGVHADWAEIADAWRDLYVPSMERVRQGDLPWTNFDRLHRISLDQVLAARGLDRAIDADARDEFTHAWERLPPWPDTIAGLERLRSRFIVATLSNGNRAQQTALVAFAALPFERLISAEDFQHYKPDPEVYLGACSALGFEPGQVMMVAAHKSDLRAAQATGMRAAFVERPLEKGPGREPELLPDQPADVQARDFIDLAQQLGC